ncbi:MAG: EamA family transporter, partial [Vicinamibacterales bacterium]|nr:EamA family transporter [Vicinamibacterales bacterium]
MTPTRDRTLLVLLAFVTVYVVWGSTYLAIRFGIETIPPFFMAGVRFCIGGTLFVSWAVARGAPPPERSLWPPAALVGALMIVGGIGGVTWAEQFVPSGLTALLIAMVPLWVVLI